MNRKLREFEKQRLDILLMTALTLPISEILLNDNSTSAIQEERFKEHLEGGGGKRIKARNVANRCS